jgi:hypothetical protein
LVKYKPLKLLALKAAKEFGFNPQNYYGTPKLFNLNCSPTLSKNDLFKKFYGYF